MKKYNEQKCDKGKYYEKMMNTYCCNIKYHCTDYDVENNLNCDKIKYKCQYVKRKCKEKQQKNEE